MHTHCNLNVNYRYSPFVQGTLPKLTNYDSYLLFKDLVNKTDHSVPNSYIPKTDQRSNPFFMFDAFLV